MKGTELASPNSPLIALFPEASFGAALNCVGIAQKLRERGARPVFICHSSFSGVFADYGFQEYHLPADRQLTAAARQSYWQDFVNRHLPHFQLAPIDQIEAYVAPAWEAIVDTAIRADAPLRQLLSRLRPDAIVLDNVVIFPAVASAGCPWVRVISCAETELPDALVPPYLSGMATSDRAGHEAFRSRYLEAVAPAHERLNQLLLANAMPAYPPGVFLEASPYLNLLLTPCIVRHERADPLDPERFVYLEACVRDEGPFEVPTFPKQDDKPLVYLSFGSLGAMDVALFERLIAVFATIPARFLVNVGPFRDTYREVPDNVYLDAWFPQPSVVAAADLFIHHGGNNSLCEALAFGVPSLVMPYCWDGHDNARRVQETGVGRMLSRSGWTDAELRDVITALLGDTAMKRLLAANAARMRKTPGADAAAAAIMAQVARSKARPPTGASQ